MRRTGLRSASVNSVYTAAAKATSTSTSVPQPSDTTDNPLPPASLPSKGTGPKASKKGKAKAAARSDINRPVTRRASKRSLELAEKQRREKQEEDFVEQVVSSPDPILLVAQHPSPPSATPPNAIKSLSEAPNPSRDDRHQDDPESLTPAPSSPAAHPQPRPPPLPHEPAQSVDTVPPSSPASLAEPAPPDREFSPPSLGFPAPPGIATPSPPPRYPQPHSIRQPGKARAGGSESSSGLDLFAHIPPSPIPPAPTASPPISTAGPSVPTRLNQVEQNLCSSPSTFVRPPPTFPLPAKPQPSSSPSIETRSQGSRRGSQHPTTSPTNGSASTWQLSGAARDRTGPAQTWPAHPDPPGPAHYIQPNFQHFPLPPGFPPHTAFPPPIGSTAVPFWGPSVAPLTTLGASAVASSRQPSLPQGPPPFARPLQFAPPIPYPLPQTWIPAPRPRPQHPYTSAPDQQLKVRLNAHGATYIPPPPSLPRPPPFFISPQPSSRPPRPPEALQTRQIRPLPARANLASERSAPASLPIDQSLGPPESLDAKSPSADHPSTPVALQAELPPGAPDPPTSQVGQTNHSETPDPSVSALDAPRTPRESVPSPKQPRRAPSVHTEEEAIPAPHPPDPRRRSSRISSRNASGVSAPPTTRSTSAMSSAASSQGITPAPKKSTPGSATRGGRKGGRPSRVIRSPDEAEEEPSKPPESDPRKVGDDDGASSSGSALTPPPASQSPVKDKATAEGKRKGAGKGKKRDSVEMEDGTTTETGEPSGAADGTEVEVAKKLKLTVKAPGTGAPSGEGGNGAQKSEKTGSGKVKGKGKGPTIKLKVSPHPLTPVGSEAAKEDLDPTGDPTPPARATQPKIDIPADTRGAQMEDDDEGPVRKPGAKRKGRKSTSTTQAGDGSAQDNAEGYAPAKGKKRRVEVAEEVMETGQAGDVAGPGLKLKLSLASAPTTHEDDREAQSISTEKDDAADIAVEGEKEAEKGKGKGKTAPVSERKGKKSKVSREGSQATAQPIPPNETAEAPADSASPAAPGKPSPLPTSAEDTSSPAIKPPARPVPAQTKPAKKGEPLDPRKRRPPPPPGQQPQSELKKPPAIKKAALSAAAGPSTPSGAGGGMGSLLASTLAVLQGHGQEGRKSDKSGGGDKDKDKERKDKGEGGGGRADKVGGIGGGKAAGSRTGEWVLTPEQRKEYEDSREEREAARRVRDSWKANAVNLQEAKDAYRLDSIQTRVIKTKGGMGIRTDIFKPSDMLKQLLER